MNALLYIIKADKGAAIVWFRQKETMYLFWAGYNRFKQCELKIASDVLIEPVSSYVFLFFSINKPPLQFKVSH